MCTCAAEGDEFAPVLPFLVLLLLALGQMLRRLPQVLIPCRNHDRQNRLTRTPMNDTAAMRLPAAEIAPGQPQRLGQPVHDDRLELGDGGAADPIEVGAVEGIRVHLSQGGRVAAGAGEERHEARAGPVGDAREDLGLDVGVDGGPWLRVEGRVRGEEGTEVAWFDGGDDAAVGDGVVVFGDWEVVG